MNGDITARVKGSAIHSHQYKINELGVAAIKRLLEPGNCFEIVGLGPRDTATLTVSVTFAGDGQEQFGRVQFELPAWMLEEIQ